MLDLKKPFFEEGMKKYKNDFCRDQQIAKPKLVWAQEFKGGLLLLYHGCRMYVFSVLECYSVFSVFSA